MASWINHPLKHPVDETILDANGKETRILITEVRIRRMKGKDQIFAAENSEKPTLGFLLLSRLTGLSMIEIGELDGEDLDTLEKIVEGFSPPGRPTGQTSSEI